MAVKVKCGCTGCNNVATHTWSGHPTCNGCSSRPHLKYLPDRVFEQPYSPQVGEECEYINSRTDIPTPQKWTRVFYVGLSKDGYKLVQEFDHAACIHLDESEGGVFQFRPIQSERDKFIQEFVDDDFICQDELAVAAIAERMYDKGYRKNE